MMMVDADFQPGERARFRDRPEIEVFVEAMHVTVTGRVFYAVVWWRDDCRTEGLVNAGELEAIPQEARA